MKNTVIVVALGISIAGVIYAYVTPNVGKGKNEMLVRTWVETEEIESDLSHHTGKEEKKQGVKKSKEKGEAPTSDSLLNTSRAAKPTTGSSSLAVKKITKKETLKAHPVKFSRAAQFRPVNRETIQVDTVFLAEELVVQDSVQ